MTAAVLTVKHGWSSSLEKIGDWIWLIKTTMLIGSLGADVGSVEFEDAEACIACEQGVFSFDFFGSAA